MPLQYEMHRVPRSGEPDIEFEGAEVARSSSKRDEFAERWTELVVYVTRQEKFVLVVRGVSTIQGEVDRVTAIIARDAKDFAKRIYQPDGNGSYYLSFPAKLILRQLAEKFPQHRELFDETERI